MNNVTNDHTMIEYAVLPGDTASTGEGDNRTLHPINGRCIGAKGESNSNNECGLGEHPVKGVRW